MMNIIRADIYRFVRGKGIYITMLVLLAVIVIQILVGSNMNAGVNTNSFDMAESMTAGDIEVALADLFHSPTGAEAPLMALQGSANLPYFLMPFLVFIACTDFTSDTAKNALSSGVSRSKYYFGKLALSGICCVLMFVFYVVVSTLFATIINGFNGVFDGAFLWSILQVFLPQLWLLLAGVCVGHFLVFVCRRTSAFIGSFIAFLLVPQLVFTALILLSDKLQFLFDYELSMIIGALSDISAMTAGDIVKSLLIGAGYIAVSVAAGFAIFKKAEVK